mmetsp:Transcript_405/g.799  ORF Transcript_405/g.799 Transcript_405/m.799 type:complete len:312 (-) Transcript_405:400-1335(-)
MIAMRLPLGRGFDICLVSFGNVIQVGQNSTFQMINRQILRKKLGLQRKRSGLFATNPSRAKHGNGLRRSFFLFLASIVSVLFLPFLIIGRRPFVVVVECFAVVIHTFPVQTPIVFVCQCFQIFRKLRKSLRFRIQCTFECPDFHFVSIPRVDDHNVGIPACLVPLGGREVLAFGFERVGFLILEMTICQCRGLFEDLTSWLRGINVCVFHHVLANAFLRVRDNGSILLRGGKFQFLTTMFQRSAQTQGDDLRLDFDFQSLECRPRMLHLLQSCTMFITNLNFIIGLGIFVPDTRSGPQFGPSEQFVMFQIL